MKIFLVVEDVSGCCGGYEPVVATELEDVARTFCEQQKAKSEDPRSRFGYMTVELTSAVLSPSFLSWASDASHDAYTEWPPPPPPVYEPPPEPKPLRIYPAVLA